jgi:dTDP-4-dehydrorhamnose reductase
MAGHVMARWLREDHHEWDIRTHVYRNPVSESDIVLDLYQDQNGTEGIDALFEDVQPDVVINCVGLLVSESKLYPAKAAFLNSYLPHYISRKCRTIHLSTDCVFSGKDGKAPYREPDHKSETSEYGRSKSSGEIQDGTSLTIRTSIIGPELKENGSGLFAWFMRQDGEISGWSNAWWNGVTTLELAKFVCRTIDRDAFSSDPNPELFGICHLHSLEKVSKFELLSVFKDRYERGVTIIPTELDQEIDKTLQSTRGDINSWYTPKTIEELVQEQHAWHQK